MRRIFDHLSYRFEAGDEISIMMSDEISRLGQQVLRRSGGCQFEAYKSSKSLFLARIVLTFSQISFLTAVGHK